jgi:hypothetical protein
MGPVPGQLTLLKNIQNAGCAPQIAGQLNFSNRWRKVVGVDISPHMQPEYVPQNLWLQVSVTIQPSG